VEHLFLLELFKQRGDKVNVNAYSTSCPLPCGATKSPLCKRVSATISPLKKGDEGGFKISPAPLYERGE